MLQAADASSIDSSETLEGWADLFGLFADRTRLRILLHLSRHDELHVGALCELLGQSQPAVSHHLSRLREAGVLGVRRDGKLRHYRLLPKRHRDVLNAAFAGLKDDAPAAQPAAPPVAPFN